jgi:rSAM/selenodomain-associated transferase 1
MTDPTRERIILFLKNFQAGRVKTRLAARLGDRAALQVYRAMVGDLLSRLEPLRGILIPYFDALPGRLDRAPTRPPAVSDLRSGGLLNVQCGEDLGERMYNAFEEVFAGGTERAILIGSDIPQIDGTLLEGYLEALRSYPLVLGPAADGGYYLIGFQSRCFDAALFRDIDWSTDQVLEQTLERARALELPCHIGTELQDVDTIEDLEALLSADLPEGSLLEILRYYLVHSGS